NSPERRDGLPTCGLTTGTSGSNLLLVFLSLGYVEDMRVDGIGTSRFGTATAPHAPNRAVRGFAVPCRSLPCTAVAAQRQKNGNDWVLTKRSKQLGKLRAKT